MISQIVGLLLLYLSPAETYCVAFELIRSSKEHLTSEELRNMIRWHLPLGNEDMSRLHSAFGHSYVMTTLRKKRSLAIHMKNIGFDMMEYARAAFNSLTGDFLPLHILTDFLLMYLVEGIKIVFRYAYAILKCHKNFIKNSCSD
jgi:hypothetical protein